MVCMASLDGAILQGYNTAGLQPFSMKLVDHKQSKKIQEEQKRDVALYFVEDGEAGFNPAWNKAVIERTIKKSEALRRKKAKQYIENVRERADAVATYLKSRAAEGSTPIEKYFGRQYFSYLAGRKIRSNVMEMNAAKNSGMKNVAPFKRKVYLPSD